MKKFLKFLCGAASMAAVAFGAYCVYKNVIAKKDDEDFYVINLNNDSLEFTFEIQPKVEPPGTSLLFVFS